MGKYKNQQIKVLQKLLTKFHIRPVYKKKHALSKTSVNMTTNRNKSQKN